MTTEEKPSNVNERTYQEVEYLKKNLGPVLVAALAEICIRRPADPIEYLGHWLLRWRYNEELKRRDVQNALEVVHQKQWESAQAGLHPPSFTQGVTPGYPNLPPGYGGPLVEEEEEVEPPLSPPEAEEFGEMEGEDIMELMAPAQARRSTEEKRASQVGEKRISAVEEQRISVAAAEGKRIPIGPAEGQRLSATLEEKRKSSAPAEEKRASVAAAEGKRASVGPVEAKRLSDTPAEEKRASTGAAEAKRLSATPAEEKPASLIPGQQKRASVEAGGEKRLSADGGKRLSAGQNPTPAT